MAQPRRFMLIRHLQRPEANELAQQVENAMKRHGIIPVGDDYPGEVELIIALGGDGTLLSAADRAREANLPLIGINLGHMGFLTEVESDRIGDVVDHLACVDYRVDDRMTLDVTVKMPDGTTQSDWALNEAALVNADLQHPARLGVGVDGRGLSTYGADGIIVATPTGSTAYSFSAGGPIVWPDVEAVVVAPLAAHGLFTRPIVISPSSVLHVSFSSRQNEKMVLICDGTRKIGMPAGATMSVTKGKRPVKLIRVSTTPFIERLVHKFDLPVSGWKAMNND